MRPSAIRRRSNRTHHQFNRFRFKNLWYECERFDLNRLKWWRAVEASRTPDRPSLDYKKSSPFHVAVAMMLEFGNSIMLKYFTYISYGGSTSHFLLTIMEFTCRRCSTSWGYFGVILSFSSRPWRELEWECIRNKWCKDPNYWLIQNQDTFIEVDFGHSSCSSQYQTFKYKFSTGYINIIKCDQTVFTNDTKMLQKRHECIKHDVV